MLLLISYQDKSPDAGITWNLRKTVDLVLNRLFQSDMLPRFAKSGFSRALSDWVFFAGFSAGMVQLVTDFCIRDLEKISGDVGVLSKFWHCECLR